MCVNLIQHDTFLIYCPTCALYTCKCEIAICMYTQGGREVYTRKLCVYIDWGWCCWVSKAKLLMLSAWDSASLHICISSHAELISSYFKCRAPQLQELGTRQLNLRKLPRGNLKCSQSLFTFIPHPSFTLWRSIYGGFPSTWERVLVYVKVTVSGYWLLSTMLMSRTSYVVFVEIPSISTCPPYEPHYV